MSKTPSDATLIRTLKRQLSEANSSFASMKFERDHFRARATKAEQEVAEWKTRFDILLRRDEAAK